MKNIESAISTIEKMLDTKQKRHIVGGLLISAAFFLASLAFTTLSMKNGGIYE